MTMLSDNMLNEMEKTYLSSSINSWRTSVKAEDCLRNFTTLVPSVFSFTWPLRDSSTTTTSSPVRATALTHDIGQWIRPSSVLGETASRSARQVFVRCELLPHSLHNGHCLSNSFPSKVNFIIPIWNFLLTEVIDRFDSKQCIPSNSRCKKKITGVIFKSPVPFSTWKSTCCSGKCRISRSL